MKVRWSSAKDEPFKFDDHRVHHHPHLVGDAKWFFWFCVNILLIDNIFNIKPKQTLPTNRRTNSFRIRLSAILSYFVMYKLYLYKVNKKNSSLINGANKHKNFFFISFSLQFTEIFFFRLKWKKTRVDLFLVSSTECSHATSSNCVCVLYLWILKARTKHKKKRWKHNSWPYKEIDENSHLLQFFFHKRLFGRH